MSAKGKKVEFGYVAMAESVSVAGSFNNWDAAANPLRRVEGDRWSIEMKLPKGRHEYLFVVDGQWMSDPRCKQSVPNPHGGENSVLVI